MTGPAEQPAGAFALAVDLGTSNTVAVLRWPDGRTRPILFDGQPLLPSGVYVDPYGRPHVGYQALTANAFLTFGGALGYVTELLSGDFNTAFGRSSHHQVETIGRDSGSPPTVVWRSIRRIPFPSSVMRTVSGSVLLRNSAP